jgi:hypothetical protein
LTARPQKYKKCRSKIEKEDEREHWSTKILDIKYRTIRKMGRRREKMLLEINSVLYHNTR